MHYKPYPYWDHDLKNAYQSKLDFLDNITNRLFKYLLVHQNDSAATVRAGARQMIAQADQSISLVKSLPVCSPIKISYSKRQWILGSIFEFRETKILMHWIMMGEDFQEGNTYGGEALWALSYHYLLSPAVKWESVSPRDIAFYVNVEGKRSILFEEFFSKRGQIAHPLNPEIKAKEQEVERVL